MSVTLLCSFLPLGQAWAAENDSGSSGGGDEPPSNTVGVEGTYSSDEIIVIYDDKEDGSIQTYSLLSVEENLQSRGYETADILVEADETTNTIAVLDIPNGTSVSDALDEVKSQPGVLYAQPNFIYHLLDEEVDLAGGASTTVSPDSSVITSLIVNPLATVNPLVTIHPLATTVDDPIANISDTSVSANQYWLYNTKAFDAWDYARCNGTVTVALIDTGAYLTHEDLQANILDEYAYDTYYNKKLGSPGDYYGHGSHVAGIMSGVVNNGTGIAGASYNASIIPIKACDNSISNPGFYTSNLVSAYEYLLGLVDDRKVTDLHVINMSLGGYGALDSTDEALKALIKKARDDYDILTVCAGGNGDDYGNPYTITSYPSDWDECMAVTALKSDGTNAYWSDYNEFKDISAPGVSIYSTYKTNSASYISMSGTSMASPLVAGLAALCWAVNPEAKVADVFNAITSTADEIVDTTNDRRTTSGSAGAINAAAAASQIGGAVLSYDSSVLYRTQTMQFSASCQLADITEEDWAWSIESITGEATIDENGLMTAVSAGTVRVNVTATESGEEYKGATGITIKEIELPADPTVTTSRIDKVDISWQQATAATGYQILRSELSTDDFQVIAMINDPEVLTYSDTEADPSKPYLYRVRPLGTLDAQTVEGATSNAVMGVMFAAVSTLATQTDVSDAFLIKNYIADTSVDTVIVVGDEDSPEALTATGLAGIFNALIVVTDQNELSFDTAKSIASVAPDRVIILGDTSTVSEGVYESICDIVSDPSAVSRYSKETDAELAEQVYDLGKGSWSDTAIIVSEKTDSADALAIGAYAYAKQAPILVTSASTGRLSAQSRQILRVGAFAHAIIIGNTDEVGAEVEIQLNGAGIGDSSILRIHEDDPYLTSAAIASNGIAEGVFEDDGFFVSDLDFRAALHAASIAGYNREPLVFVNEDNEEGLSAALAGLSGEKFDTVTFVDGKNPLSSAEKTRIARMVKLVQPALVDISTATVADIAVCEYTGEALTPNVQVTMDNTPLTEGSDYQIRYANNVDVGIAEVNIIGKGEYAGVATKTFSIVTPDTTGLDAAIRAATIDKDSTAISTDGTDLNAGTDYVTPAVNETFARAIADAELVMSDSNATKAQVAAAVDALNAAKTVFDGAKQSAGAITVTGLKLNRATAFLVIGNVSRLIATVNPSDAPDKTVVWASSNPNVVMVDADGKITGLAAGAATITATSVNGRSATCKVTVTRTATWSRLAGDDRYATMNAIVSSGFSDTGGTVILATGNNFPDALAASALAGNNDAPIVITASSSLSVEAKVQLERLAPSKVIIVGGKNAVSDSVLSEVDALSFSPDISRVAGETRESTSLEIYKSMGAGCGDTCIVVTGLNFADALSVSPYAYAAKAPVFLTGSSGELSGEQVSAIMDGGFEHVVIVGGTTAVSSSVEASQLSGISCVRLKGDDRYETSAAIADWEIEQGMSADGMAVATGANYPDALAGGPVCGSTNSIIVLATEGGTTALDSIVKTNKDVISYGYFLGGTSAVSDSLISLVKGYTK